MIHEATVDAIRSRDRHFIGVVMDEHLSYLEDVWQAETGERLRSVPTCAFLGRLGDRKWACL